LIVNQTGHFAAADRPEQASRFLMASTGFDSATGGFPTSSRPICMCST
jgi:hypothetical protein